MPTVVVVANGEIFGGAERQVLTLAEGLRTSWRVVLITFCEGELARRARELGLQTHVLQTGSPLDLRALRRLRQEILALRPDVLHVHGYRATVYAGLTGAWRTTARRVKTEHGAPEWPRGFASKFRLAVYMVADKLATYAMRADVVYVTQDLAERMHMALLGPMTVIRNGIMPIVRRPSAQSPYRGNRPKLVMVGRIERVKAIDIAVTAIHAISKELDCELHIVGRGSEERAITRLVERYRLQDRVILHGHVPEPYDYIAYADCLLMTSRHEGLPYTLLEAMSLGTPVIATNVGGLREVLQDHQNALLVPPDDAGSLCSAIREIVSDAGLRVRLVRAAQRQVSESLSARVMTISYAQLYQRAD